MPEARLGALADGIYGQELERRIDEAANAIRSVLAQESELASPRLAIVLGSGLGDVVDLLDPRPRIRIPYGEIPNIPRGSVGGHAGELVAGVAAGTPAIVLSGRTHAYEGYSPREVTILIRACLALGARTLVLTNASGFAGVDGIFRFRPDGTNQRGLAVLRVTSSGGQVISPAPRAFGGPGT